MKYLILLLFLSFFSHSQVIDSDIAILVGDPVVCVHNPEESIITTSEAFTLMSGIVCSKLSNITSSEECFKQFDMELEDTL